MKKWMLSLVALASFFTPALRAQDISGNWQRDTEGRQGCSVCLEDRESGQSLDRNSLQRRPGVAVPERIQRFAGWLNLQIQSRPYEHELRGEAELRWKVHERDLDAGDAGHSARPDACYTGDRVGYSRGAQTAHTDGGRCRPVVRRGHHQAEPLWGDEH